MLKQDLAPSVEVEPIACAHNSPQFISCFDIYAL